MPKGDLLGHNRRQLFLPLAGPHPGGSGLRLASSSRVGSELDVGSSSLLGSSALPIKRGGGGHSSKTREPHFLVGSAGAESNSSFYLSPSQSPGGGGGGSGGGGIQPTLETPLLELVENAAGRLKQLMTSSFEGGVNLASINTTSTSSSGGNSMMLPGDDMEGSGQHQQRLEAPQPTLAVFYE